MINISLNQNEFELLDSMFHTTVSYDVNSHTLQLSKNDYLACLPDAFFRKVAIKIPEAIYNEISIVTEGIPLSSSFKARIKLNSGDLSSDFCFIQIFEKRTHYLNNDLIDVCDLIHALNSAQDLDQKKIFTSKLIKLAMKCAVTYGLKVDRSLASVAAPIILENPILSYRDDGNGEFSFRVTDSSLTEDEKNFHLKATNGAQKAFTAFQSPGGKLHTFVPTPEFRKVDDIVRSYDRSKKSNIEEVIKKIETELHENNVSMDLSNYSDRILGFGVFRATPMRVLDRQAVSWFSDNDVEYFGPQLSLSNGEIVKVKPSDAINLKQQIDAGKDPIHLEIEGKDVLLNCSSANEIIDEIDARTIKSTDLNNLDFESLQRIQVQTENPEWDYDTLIDGSFYIPQDESFKSEIEKCIKESIVSKPGQDNEKIQALIKNNLDKLDYCITPGAPKLVISVQPPSLRKQFTLKSYQLEGINKFRSIYATGSNTGVLMADDMGLGKTLQILSFLDILYNKEKSKNPSLIVVPTALVKNWNNPDDDVLKPILLKSEINKFFEDKTFSVFNADTAEKVKMIPLILKSGVQLVITTYDWISRAKYEDYFFKNTSWEVVCFDECQKIKNEPSNMSQAAKKFKAKMTICCTATPIENDLSELWNIMDTCIPGLLGSMSDFRSKARKAYEEEEKFNQFLRDVKSIIDPFMIRRLKKDIPDLDLPKKTFHLAQLPMSKPQRLAYENVIKVSKKRGMEGINALKYISLHPKLSEDSELDIFEIADGGSLDWMISKIMEIVASGEKVLIFSRMKIIQELLLVAFQKEAKKSVWLGRVFGGTPKSKRQYLIDDFKRHPGGAVFILAPDVLGYGVTLIEANHVFHVDRLWNPAKEDQATDRIYRIGQTKDVHVYMPLSSFVETAQLNNYVGTDDFINRSVSTPDRKSFDEHLDSVLQRKSILATDFFGVTFFKKGESFESTLNEAFEEKV